MMGSRHSVVYASRSLLYLSLNSILRPYHLGSAAACSRGQNLAPCLGDEQSVFELGGTLSITSYSSPVIGPLRNTMRKHIMETDANIGF